MTEFKLEDNDCAIVLKEDGSTEILVPNYEDEEAEISDNMLLAIGIVNLIPKPEFQELISETITEVLSEISNE